MRDGLELQPGDRRLCDFLRSRQDEIVSTWAQRVRSTAPARELSESAIVDHLPEILRLIADYIEAVQTGRAVPLEQLAHAHAVDRLGRGFDFDQIIGEYALLRRTILDLWESEMGPSIDLSEARNLAAAFDEAIAQSALRYADARERLLKALDQVSEAALRSTNLDGFFDGLLRATLDGTESVDTCVVFLRNGDVLRARAAVGLEEELPRGFSLRIGEGFAGHIAAEGRSAFVRDASVDPVVVSPVLKAQGVHAIYGVPMVRDGQVIGVGYIGSRTAYEFSDEDKLLFRTMVNRAASGLVKAQILADLHRAEAGQRFLADASRQFAESLDYETTLATIARLAVPAIADWCVVDLASDDTIQRVALAHRDPNKEHRVRELDSRYPFDPALMSSVPRVIRTGRSEWNPEMSDEDLAAAGRGPGHALLLRELGTRSYIIVPIAVRDHVFGAISLVRGDSGRRYSDADLTLGEELGRRAATAIENARLYAEAQKAVAARDQVLAIVSHDLRNQLGVIGMGANLLEKNADAAGTSGDLTKPIDTIRRTTDTMQHLLHDLLDMASIEAGQLSFEPDVIDLTPVLEEACQVHEVSARANGLQLNLEPPSRAVAVRGDRKRISQLLANLLGNAIKFSNRGGTIVMTADAGHTDVTVSVSDNGPGIAPADLQTIFEPYKTSRREARSGTGLGLYIARGIVQRHGGRIWVESEPGKGSAFFFTLPRAH
jgi:signal transduction histidine kinase/putative methionine-R-sulfoxide reductase with GAF domain